MKITFIQKQAFPYLGVMSLAGYLKKFGHECSVLIDSVEEGLIKRLKEEGPDIIGVSCLSTEHKWAKNMVNAVKREGVSAPVILGGMHAVLYNHVLNEIKADLLCACEGEYVIKELLARQDFMAEGHLSGVRGIARLSGGRLVVNDLPDLVAPLDFMEDRTIYYGRYPFLARQPLKQFMSSRGCNEDCYFCQNRMLKQKYKGKGMYVRSKDVDVFIQEIEGVSKIYGCKSIHIVDDNFAADQAWLERFSGLYKKQVNIPYDCAMRAGSINKDICNLLKRSGCHTVNVGIETGSERLRAESLGKKISNELILKAARIIQEAGLKLQTTNVFCIPGETPEDALETVNFNKKLKADYTYSFILAVLPGTRLEKIALEQGCLERGVDFGSLPNLFFTSHTQLMLKDANFIENVQRSLFWCVKYDFLYSVFLKIFSFKIKWFFQFLNLLGIFVVYMKERKLNVFEAAALFWRFRKAW